MGICEAGRLARLFLGLALTDCGNTAPMPLAGWLGLPFAIWAGVISPALTAVFARDRAVVWLRLAASVFLRAAGFSNLADPVAAAAGLTYLAFLAATFARRAPPAN